ncbi:hypothetical protein N181_20700 [Sinorhizobium fredii USDA 205]|nr:Acylphosphate phosphohydrolase, putative [Sinorhizobium fredii CCBAU 83666]AWM27858.1 Acylphosphate phosphohydrolase putative [Sinorhizobium fredii CCBAU 25509]KSV86862.1 hypothetical protein N181_20700 [Sinorhizobium fredii USDA 205]
MFWHCGGDRASAHASYVKALAFGAKCPRFGKNNEEAAMAGDRKAALVRITGKVQGVCFRVWTRDEAERLGLAGWVRNETDGSVTALIAGPDTAVATMLGRFWKGPPGASVADVAIEDASTVEAPAGFRITR